MRIYKKFLELINIVLSSVDSWTARSRNDLRNRANSIIKTYNDIIYDIHSNFRSRDAQIDRFSKIEELESPTLNDMNIKIIILENLGQILGYLIRWM